MLIYVGTEAPRDGRGLESLPGDPRGSSEVALGLREIGLLKGDR